MHPMYDVIREGFFYAILIMCPLQYLSDAQFGRFATDSIFSMNGILGWIIMELPSPIALVYAFTKAPLIGPGALPPTAPQLLLAALFLAHYANRALISPLRTPSRSTSHVSVVLGGIWYNTTNGLLMGSYLRSDMARSFLSDAFDRPLFWGGVIVWFAGLLGNIIHDEVLLNIRRKAKAKGKANSTDGATKKQGQHYAVPHGYLYKYVSYPNYFCEWVEWAAFVVAAAPPPPLTSFSSLLQNISPPWLFLLSEVAFMLPRALKGHQWYHDKFPEYPKGRKVIIPFLL